MRLWECDKCRKQEKGMYKPKGWYDVKFYAKAQSKGGESFGCHLSNKCAKETFNLLRILEKEKNKNGK